MSSLYLLGSKNAGLYVLPRICGRKYYSLRLLIE
jgi:hypothetical protein